MPKPTSKAQARLFGAIAGGEAHVKGFSKKQAKNRLRGTNIGKLPKFHSRSVHGSGEFTEKNIEDGYRCEPEYGEAGQGCLHGRPVIFEGLKGG
jgi:hypothetical protein